MTNTKWLLLSGGFAVLAFIGGSVTGFFAGVYSTRAGSEFIDDLFEQEKPADVKNAVVLARPSFALKYPGNWKIDSTDEDYDPDHNFSIDSPGSCFVNLTIFDAATDPTENVEGQIAAYAAKLIRDPTRTDFDTWGSFRGSGALLRGNLLGLLPGYVRLFSAAVDERSFVIIEFCYDEDAKMVEPGLRLIESSFAFR